MLSRIQVIGTGSSGNCYKLKFDTNEGDVVLDCGVTDNIFHSILTLFTTHKHKDHIREIESYKANNINIISYEDTNDSGQIGSLKWERFKIPHEVDNYGYIISYDNEKIGYITDCGDYTQINKDLSDLTYLLIECNWDYFLIKNDIIKALPHSVYAFSKEGHMSNLDTINAIAKWKINKDCKIVFIHKSDHHANYDTTYNIFKSLPNKWIVAEGGKTIFCKSWKII